MSDAIPTPPTRAEARTRARARALRAALARQGRAIGHGQALDLLARQLGLRDWNALSARIGPKPDGSPPRHLPEPGARVAGRYLGQFFTGQVLKVDPLARGGRRVSLAFDAPVDTVRFSGFGNLRRRVTADLDRHGRCPSVTSDGQPHLEIRFR
ncbi:MAG: hypothetical protein CML66_06475 [Rhodobacteraceae bacterium]|nr:hypothetical protein [Paracoccaceae bacterium]MAY45566.1 hypothetical protein [Paracoccaceae bacterium]